MTIHLSGAQTGREFSLIEGSMPPDGDSGLHMHTREDETFHLLEGELHVTIGEKNFVLRAKESCFAPRNIPHRLHLSFVLGNLDQAIRLYEQAVALDPLRTNSYLTLGHLLYVAGRHDEAQTTLQKALDLNPQTAYAHLTRGQILIAQGKPQQALAEIEKEPSDWGELMGETPDCP
jgi:tetratricopeptide (TPR) repeat protein